MQKRLHKILFVLLWQAILSSLSFSQEELNLTGTWALSTGGPNLTCGYYNSSRFYIHQNGNQLSGEAYLYGTSENCPSFLPGTLDGSFNGDSVVINVRSNDGSSVQFKGSVSNLWFRGDFNGGNWGASKQAPMIIANGFAPNEQLVSGEKRLIQWQSKGVDTVRILFSTDNGNSYSVIENQFPNSEPNVIDHKSYNDFLWLVPDVNSKECRIKIEGTREDPMYGVIFGLTSKFNIVFPCPSVSWDGGGDGSSFSDSLNWSNDHIPSSDDIALFSNNTAPSVEFSQDIFNDGLKIKDDIVSLNLNDHLYYLTGICGPTVQVDGDAQLTIENGILSSLANDIIGGPTGSPEFIIRNNANVSVLDSGNMKIAAVDTAQLIFQDNGKFTSPHKLIIGADGNPGYTLVQVTPDSNAITVGELILGQGNYGALKIEGGSVLTDSFKAAESSGSEANVFLFGSGSSLIIGGNANIGIDGIANITSHSYAGIGGPFDADWILGVNQSGEGNLKLEVGAQLISTGGSIVVGDKGLGHIGVLSGSRFEFPGTVWVGRQSGSAGSITVDDGGIGDPSRMIVDRMCVGCGGAGVVGVDSLSFLQINTLQVGKLGVVRGPVLSLHTINQLQKKISSFQKGTSPDSIGITTGEVIVEEGADLQIDSVLFGTDAHLGGSAVFSFEVNNHGLVTPGDSLGLTDTLTINNNYNQFSDGTLEIELGNPSDILLITGSTQLGGTLRVGLAYGFTPAVGDTFHILHSNQPINGTFEQTEFFSGVEGYAAYNQNDIYFVLTKVTAVEDKELTVLPKDFILYQNYPNPFNPTTTISWQSPVSSHQTLKVYDLLGREVATLVDEYNPAGSYEIQFDASGLTSGIYFYKLQAGNFVETKKMILLR